jgi:hypothetical protein
LRLKIVTKGIFTCKVLNNPIILFMTTYAIDFDYLF